MTKCPQNGYRGLLSSLILICSCGGYEPPSFVDHRKTVNINENHQTTRAPDDIREVDAPKGTKVSLPTDISLVEVTDRALDARNTSSIPRLSGGGGGGGGVRGSRSVNTDHVQDMEMLLHWNEITIDASGRDHNQPGLIFTEAVREQLGPGRSSRALAIVHIAIFEVVNAIEGGYETYIGLPRVNDATSMRAGIAQACHDTLAALFPSQASLFDAKLLADLESISDGEAKTNGIELGHQAANAILTMRATDGSILPEPVVGVDYLPSNDPGIWRTDPVSNIPIALGARWYMLAPFALKSSDQFRVPPPPALDSPEYTAAYEEVKRVGGDGINTPTERTPEQTDIGFYWAYDGTPSLCAPPRLFNQIAVTIAEQMGTDMVSVARLLALVNIALSDATLAVWESKYFYQFWRPITAIRESDVGTGPSNLGDGNPDTIGDIGFTPLGSPASNMVDVPNFTPPFPAYPSGHAGMGGALFEMLRKFYGRDDIAFTFVSDELDGVTRDREGNVRPLKPRRFQSFSEAEEENGQSRIYLGIHWAFDKNQGIAQGRKVADYVWNHMFKPVN